MAFDFTGMTRYLARGAAVAVVALGASACSSMPGWMGGDSTPSASADDQADQQAAADASTPDLNSVPDKPTAPSTSDDQKALADSLGADRSQNQYSSDQLRGGTEAAAAPPGASAPDQTASAPAGAPPPDQTADASAPAQPAPAPPPSSAGTPPSDSGTIDAAAAANASPDDQTPPAAIPPAPATTTADNAAVPAVPAQPQQQVAMNTPPPAMTPSGAPAVPDVVESAPSYNELVNPSDAALGFKPSMAPPLSPSVAQFVPQPIIARYQQTAAMGRSAGVDGAYASASNRAVGGPEHMSGAVVANFDSLNPGGAIPSYSAYGAPSAVVMFSGDRTILTAAAKQQVRGAAAAFQQTGGQGFVHVVGHSATGGNLSSERHTVLNFEHSQARATAVARELIKDGVPADKVLVETSGGADSGSSAEIFLQS